MLAHNLLIIQIILPFILGVICLNLRSNKSWILMNIGFVLNFIIAIFNFKLTINNVEPIFYHLGNWGASIGIEYKLDRFSAFFILLLSFMALANGIALRSLIQYELIETKLSNFFALMLFFVTGLQGIVIANDIFNVYVLLEISSIASYALVSSKNDIEAKKAAFNYLIFGSIGSTFILLGIGFIYALVGSLNLSIISNSIGVFIANKAINSGIILIFTGILMKSALFPLGGWLVDIYQKSPTFVASLLASTSNKVGLYLLLRLYFGVFKLNSFDFAYLEIILLSISIFALFTCAIMALKQTNVKRFLGFSSLSQIGFIVLAIALANSTSIMGAIIYCFSHSLEKISLFLAFGLVIHYITKSDDITDWRGLLRFKPWIGIIIIINLLSTIGVPLTAGFVGKWEIFKAALNSDIWYILVLSVAMLFTICYAFKFVEILFFKDDNERVVLSYDTNICIWVLTFLTALNLYIGTCHEQLIVHANKIASLLLAL